MHENYKYRKKNYYDSKLKKYLRLKNNINVIADKSISVKYNIQK